MTSRQLSSVTAASEAHNPSLAVTTCQRVERYSVEPCTCGAPHQIEGFEAVLHLAEVAAGLHSVILGEDEVMGQIRTSVKEAPQPLRSFGEAAIAAARQIRREASFDSHSGHLLDRALKLAGIPAEGALLVVGTGKMGKLVATRGASIGFRRVVVAGRREPESDWIRASGFEYVPLGELAGVGAVDVAVGCLGSAAGEFDTTRDLPPIRRLLLDLGTPRNFSDGAGTPLLTIAQLLDSQYDHRHSERRRTELQSRLCEILESRLSMQSRDSRSNVGTLRLHIEQVRQRELDRIRRLHPEIPEETLDAITRSLVNQLFHLPSKRLATTTDDDLAERVIELFEPGETEVPRP